LLKNVTIYFSRLSGTKYLELKTSVFWRQTLRKSVIKNKINMTPVDFWASTGQNSLWVLEKYRYIILRLIQIKIPYSGIPEMRKWGTETKKLLLGYTDQTRS
jgi:hypothetical protein